jgi:hypothetical protein
MYLFHPSPSIRAYNQVDFLNQHVFLVWKVWGLEALMLNFICRFSIYGHICGYIWQSAKKPGVTDLVTGPDPFSRHYFVFSPTVHKRADHRDITWHLMVSRKHCPMSRYGTVVSCTSQKLSMSVQHSYLKHPFLDHHFTRSIVFWLSVCLLTYGRTKKSFLVVGSW